MLPADTRPEHAAAAGPAVFTLADRTFVLSPLGPSEGLAIHAEFRRQCMASAKDPLSMCNDRITAAAKAGTPYSPVMVDAMVRAAMSASGRAEGKTEPSDDEIMARVNTLDGSRFLIWYRLRRADPTVTQSWVAEVVSDMEARNDVFARFAELDGLAALDAKKATATG